MNNFIPDKALAKIKIGMNFAKHEEQLIIDGRVARKIAAHLTI